MSLNRTSRFRVDDARQPASRSTLHLIREARYRGGSTNSSWSILAHRNLFAVVAWMSGALLSFSATAIAVRALAPAFSIFEMLAVRNAAGIAILLALAGLKPELRAGLKPRRFPLHLARNVLHFAGTDGWAFSLTLLPLATVFALEFTSPAWVALLAIPLLQERMTRGRFVAVVLGFAGVLIILRPGVETLQPASLLVLGVAFSFALVAIMTKRLTRTESTFSILFFMNLLQLPMNIAGVSRAFWLAIQPMHILPFIGICLGGLLSHYCLTNAYRRGDATMVVPLDFLRIPLIAFVGWQLYGEPLDPYVFLGSGCIVAGLIYSLNREAKSS